jgi:hypothetical protein
LNNYIDRASVTYSFEALFAAKRVKALISAIAPTERNPAQALFLSRFIVPAWFKDLQPPKNPRLSTHSAPPTLTAPYEEWSAYFLANPTYNPRGVPRNEDKTPSRNELAGRNLFLAIGPARPSSKGEALRYGNDHFRLLLPLFSDTANYDAKIAEFGLSINEDWAPVPYAQTANVNIPEFMRHCASCGLTGDCVSIIGAFATAWLSTDVVMAEPSLAATTSASSVAQALADPPEQKTD